jgi:cytochrome c-type biogenesis protein CcmE
MHPLRKRRLLMVFSLVIVASGAVTLLLLALKSEINFFYPPKDVMEGNAPFDKRIRIGGMVVEGSIQRKEGLQVEFRVTDYVHEVVVKYEGILPDLFSENEGVVAAGYLKEDGFFLADQVLAKHDENYMPPEVKETLSTQHQL